MISIQIIYEVKNTLHLKTSDNIRHDGKAIDENKDEDVRPCY